MSAIGSSTPMRRPARRGTGWGTSASTSSASAHSSIVLAIGPDVVEAGRERKAAVDRDEPVARLEARRAAGEGGDADRSARVGADAQRGEARCERRGAAARRAAGHVARAPGIADGAVEGVLARHAPGELVQVRLADDHGTGVGESLHGARGTRRDVLAEERRAVGRAHPGGVEQVLGRERHARRAPRAGPGAPASGRPAALARGRR